MCWKRLLGSDGLFGENCSERTSAKMLHFSSLVEAKPFLSSCGVNWFFEGDLSALVIFYILPSSVLRVSISAFHVFSLCIISSSLILLAS